MNTEFLAIKQEVYCSWSFVVESHSTRCSDVMSELQDLCGGLFSAFDDFVIPVGVEFTRQLFPPDAYVPTSEHGHPDTRLESQDVELVEEDGIALDTLLIALSSEEEGANYVSSIHIDSCKVNIRLEDGDSYVDRSNRSALYNSNERVDRAPSYDPLSIEIVHLPNVDDEDIEAPYQFIVRVKSKADIWFEDSELGRINRERLRGLLKRIDNSLAVKKLLRETDWNDTSALEDIY